MATLATLIKIGADISDLQSKTGAAVQSLDRMEKSASSISTGLTKVGGAMLAAFSVTAITGAIRSFTDLTSELTDLSAKTGISTTELQKLKFAAEQNGGSLDGVTRSIGFMAKALFGDSKSVTPALDRLGLSLNELRAMDPGEAFAAIGDAIAKVPNPMEQSALAMKLFGKAGAENLPMMKGNLRETMDAAQRLGIVLDEETVKAGDDFGDSLAVLKSVGIALIGQVLKPVLPMLVDLAKVFADIGGTVANAVAKGFKLMQIGIAGFAKEFFDSFIVISELANKVPILGKAFGSVNQENLNWAKTMSATFGAVMADLQKEPPKAAKAVRALGDDFASAEERARAAAKALKQFVQEADDMVERVQKMTKRHDDTVLSLRKGVMALQDWVKEGRVAKEVISAYVNELENWAQRMDRIKGLLDEAVPKLAEMASKMAAIAAATKNEIHGVIDQAGRDLAEAAAQARRELLGLIDTIGRFAGEIGGSWGNAIANMVGGWLEGAAAAETYEKATTKAGKAMGAMQGAMAVWHATAVQSMAGAVSAGAMAGASAGSMFGPWGTAIGAAAGALTGFLRTMNQGRNTVKEFAESFGGFDALHAKLNELGAAGETLWIELTQKVGKGNIEQAKSAIAAIEMAFEAHAQTQADAAAQAVAATEQVRAANEKAVSGVVSQINGLTAEYNRLWDSIKDEAPEEVMGIVQTQTLARMAAIEDQRENAVDNLKTLTDSLGMGFDDILTKLDEFISRLGSIPPITIPIEYDIPDGRGFPENTGRAPGTEPPGVPEFAGGSYGIRDFGSGTLAMLHGREGVFTESQVRQFGGDGAGGGMVVNIHVAGSVTSERDLADTISRHLDDRYRLHNKVRAA